MGHFYNYLMQLIKTYKKFRSYLVKWKIDHLSRKTKNWKNENQKNRKIIYLLFWKMKKWITKLMISLIGEMECWGRIFSLLSFLHRISLRRLFFPFLFFFFLHFFLFFISLLSSPSSFLFFTISPSSHCLRTSSLTPSPFGHCLKKIN